MCVRESFFLVIIPVGLKRMGPSMLRRFFVNAPGSLRSDRGTARGSVPHNPLSRGALAVRFDNLHPTRSTLVEAEGDTGALYRLQRFQFLETLRWLALAENRHNAHRSTDNMRYKAARIVSYGVFVLSDAQPTRSIPNNPASQNGVVAI